MIIVSENNDSNNINIIRKNVSWKFKKLRNHAWLLGPTN